MAGIIFDGSAEHVEGLDHGSGSGVIGNSHLQGATGGFGVHGVVGAPFAFDIPVLFAGVVGVSEVGSVGALGTTDPVFHTQVGVYGQGHQEGVMGLSTTDSGTGVYGGAASGIGAGNPDSHGIGVRGETMSGVGVQGSAFAQGMAGRFFGKVQVNGDLEVTGNLNMSSPTSDIVLSDVAEGFGTQDGEVIEPGTVVVLNQYGLLRPGDEAYDKKVAGVVSGAGDYRPAIVLDKQGWQASRPPIALMGKVYCKVDAQYAPIEVGDLLTTSRTPGHAMKADNPLKAFGSVIGKALRPLQEGQGMIPILVALQ
jgi:hypothetical protein